MSNWSGWSSNMVFLGPLSSALDLSSYLLWVGPVMLHVCPATPGCTPTTNFSYIQVIDFKTQLPTYIRALNFPTTYVRIFFSPELLALQQLTWNLSWSSYIPVVGKTHTSHIQFNWSTTWHSSLLYSSSASNHFSILKHYHNINHVIAESWSKLCIWPYFCQAGRANQTRADGAQLS